MDAYCESHRFVRPADRQRIERLMPLDDVLRRIEACIRPVEAREVALEGSFGEFVGATAAADIFVPAARPPHPVALIDGLAVRAEWTADAGSHAPVSLPQVIEIEAGQRLPDQCDAVLPFEAVTESTGVLEAAVEVIAGDGVLIPGGDAEKNELLRRAGARLRAGDLAAMMALGITTARIRRPRIKLAAGREQDLFPATAAFSWLRHAIVVDGGAPELAGGRASLAWLFAEPAADALVIVGGTGAGPGDHAVREFTDHGTLGVHGIAISPGESTAFGTTRGGAIPVLVVPSRLGGVIAAWLLVGRPMLARLTGAAAQDDPLRNNGFVSNAAAIHSEMADLPLIEKIASTVGLTEIVLVRRRDGGVEPLSRQYLAPASLARADGYIVVPAASEGFAPGSRAIVRPLP